MRPSARPSEAAHRGLWRCLKTAAVSALALFLVTGVPIQQSSGLQGHAFAAPADASSKTDALTLTDGTTISGVLLDLTDTDAVIETSAGKKFCARDDVARVDRHANAKAIDFFAKKSLEAREESHWRSLLKFCDKYGLLPEKRQCCRHLLVTAEDDDELRLLLGEARLDGKWISEREVAAKLAEGGYELKDGELVELATPPKEDPTTVVSPEKVPADPTVKILPRQALTDREREKMEKDRAVRIANAKKFRAKLDREYEGVEWINRYKHRTRYFEMHCNATMELTRRYGAIMELIRAKLSQMFKSPPMRNIRAPVFIYRNQEDFMNTDTYGRFGGRGLGGYYMPGNQSITTYHGTFGFTGTTFGVLAHEGTHYYQGLVLKGGFDNVPIWLIEGLAVYFGDGSKFDADDVRITTGLIPRDRLSHIQEKMLRKRHTTVEKLVAMTRYSGFSGSHYADAWALIYFLVNSGSKGQNLLKNYWAIGLERKLTKKDFKELASEFFGGIDELEKQYVEYITRLNPPSAGEILGEYFVSDTFQFEFKAISPKWEFFEDQSDKKLLIGLLLPGSSAQIRIFYENNLYNKKAQEYFDAYLRVAKRFENLQHEKCKIAGLDGYKLSYVDPGTLGISSIDIEFDDEGGVIISGDDDDSKDGKKREPREVIKYMLIQVDGVASIECSAKKGEIDGFRDIFDNANENFSLLFTRRW